MYDTHKKALSAANKEGEIHHYDTYLLPTYFC